MDAMEVAMEVAMVDMDAGMSLRGITTVMRALTLATMTAMDTNIQPMEEDIRLMELGTILTQAVHTKSTA